MISLAEINETAERYGVSAETIEKDYVISWILNSLSRSSIKNNFLFYGGTAIKKIYFENHRFSEDIDLISENYFPLEKLIVDLSCLSYAKDAANIDVNINENTIKSTKNREIIYIEYSCYDEITGASKEIQIDFNMRADLVGDQAERNIIQSYSDINDSPHSLHVMTLNTILANKLGMLFDITRNEPRDIFDIWFLLQRNNQFDFNFARVCEICKAKYSIYPSFSLLKQHIQKFTDTPKWNMRLAKQISDLSELKTVITEIINKLQQLFAESK